MRVLIIEDHKHKIEELTKFLEEYKEDIVIHVEQSYSSGLREIIFNHENYDLLLLDMSLHNYDISKVEHGGDPIPLAGQLILNQMYNKSILTRVIVVTMFETFAGKKLKDLDESLQNEFAENYIGYVYFSASEAGWKTDLKKMIENNFL